MATMTTRSQGSIQLPESLQSLIDSRLDTIDRMLLGRLPRGERLEIVREVESQIFEHLSERAGGEVSRDDVLDALRRLDPPEAYLPEEFDAEPAPRRQTATGWQDRRAVPLERKSNLPLASGLLAIGAMIVLVLQWPITVAFAQIFQGSNALIYGAWFAMTFTAVGLSVTAIAMAARCRLSSPWAVVGLAIGILALLGSLTFGVLGLFL